MQGQWVTSCRGFKPAISRLWEKGVSTRLVRMDLFIHNLELVLCDYTQALQDVKMLKGEKTDGQKSHDKIP